MSSNKDYIPPKVWKWEKPRAGEEWRYSGINRPIAGPTHDAELPVGKHPLQLYSRATPNGVKVTVMLEELLALGRRGAEYDAWLIDIGKGEQFGSGFVNVNPNSKIPEYSIADMAIWPCYGGLAQGTQYGAGEFLQGRDYVHVTRWTKAVAERPAVKRGRMVNRTAGDPAEQLHERHDASDFDMKTQDKLTK
ncbi:MAG TPA: hypothetical protein VG758_03910 [Hyphomicrobiaceae bacterium]|jgi:hypothetical protein|nr:hypothetical protein [Hyphomicrobiaceae bacterium]